MLTHKAVYSAMKVYNLFAGMDTKILVPLCMFIVTFVFISCNQSNNGDKFIGYYTMEKGSNDTIFIVVHDIDNGTYVAKLLRMRLKDYVFKYNADTKTLISSTNDTLSLNDNGTELRFTNENGPKAFYKMK